MSKFIVCKKVALVLAVMLVSNCVVAGEYYIALNNESKGPYDIAEIKQLLKNGEITKDSSVWKEGMDDWRKVKDEPELKVLLAKQLLVKVPPPLKPITSPPLDREQKVSDTEIDSSDKTQSEIIQQNRLSNASVIISAPDSIDKWSEEFLEKFGVKAFGESNGKIFLVSSSSTMLKPSDPQYGDALVNAYDKARTSLEEQLVITRFGKMYTNKIKTKFMDRSTNRDEIPIPYANKSMGTAEKLVAYFDKKLDVEDKKLNKELIELGEDPAKLENMPRKVKKVLLRLGFVKDAITKASGSISGLFPIQTVIFQDKTGQTVVGVIGVWSRRTEQIVKDIKLQRESVIKGKGKKVEDLLPKSSVAQQGSIGTRLFYDENGRPGIISYGLASFRPDTGDDYLDEELRQEAKEAAVSHANTFIAFVVNGRMNTKQSRKTGEEVEKFIEKELTPGADNIEKTIKNIIKVTNNALKSSAQISLQGVTTVDRWKYSQGEHKFIGVARVWKFSTLQSIRELSKSTVKKPLIREPKQRYGLERKSNVVNTLDDF